jgi:prepilin-type N-terminal cleavage/methylation domain-containing protein
VEILRRLKGFTLIELLIVVAIIGLLAIIAVPRLISLVDKAREASTKSTLCSLREAITAYYGSTEGHYPKTLDNSWTEIVIGGTKQKFSFLKSDYCKGFYPSDPNDSSKPKAWAKLRKGISNNESNEVMYVGLENAESDGRPTVKTVSKDGGWLYIRDPDGAILKFGKIEINVEQGHITINHNAEDSTQAKYYFQY